MYRLIPFLMILSGAMQGTGYGQDWVLPFGGEPAQRPAGTSALANGSTLVDPIEDEPYSLDRDLRDFAWLDSANQPRLVGFDDLVVRGQDSNGASGGGSGAGAAAATDPSAILTQFQFQNSFTPSTYDASGYSNTVILQPVLPFPVALPGLKEIFPNHIIRPTLPIIAPTADPDGPLGVQGGWGDLTLLDAFVHPVKGFGTVLFGYTAILPTSTDRQLGLGEWQLGPAVGVLYKQIPKTLVGFIYQQPFSFQSNAQQVLVQPVFVRHLPKEWYLGWGDLNWAFNTETGDYNMPLSVKVGKVGKIGCQPVNIFVQPFYTPEGLRSGPASEWGVKLNVTFLFPEKKFGPLTGSLFGRRCCRH
ncbi:MAG: hypothetical protein HQ582_07975 [Planctomycetes bacterium]|nr:hypothetical protein [Planctomycetota bacterium]